MNEKRIKYLNNTLNEQIATRQQQQQDAEFVQKQVEQRKNTDKLSYIARQSQNENQTKTQDRGLRSARANQRLELMQRMNKKRQSTRYDA